MRVWRRTIASNGAGGRVGFEINAFRAGPLMRSVRPHQGLHMPLEEIHAYFTSYDKSSYYAVACQGHEPGEDDVAAFETVAGFRMPDEFREFTMSSLGGLYLEVREELWRRAKEFDVGPFWSFLYGIKVFGIAEDIPDWLDIRVQYKEMNDSGVIGLVPFLQLVGDADCYCFDSTGTIIQLSREEPEERRPIALTFSELLMQEIRELEIRKQCKVNHEDIQDYHERVNGSIFVTSKVEVFLEKKPASLKTLLLLKDSLGLESSIGALKKASEAVPCAIARNLTYIQAIQRCEKVASIDDCIGIRLARDTSKSLPIDRRQMDAIVKK
jgi:hypothetical protein